MLLLVHQFHVAPAVPTQLCTTPTGQTVFVQLLPRQLQHTKLTGLQALHTLIRLEHRYIDTFEFYYCE